MKASSRIIPLFLQIYVGTLFSDSAYIYEYSYISGEFYNKNFKYKDKVTKKAEKLKDDKKSFIKNLLDVLFEADFIVTFNSAFVKDVIKKETVKHGLKYDISSLRFVDLMKPTAEIVNGMDGNWPKFEDLYKNLFNFNYVKIDSSHDVEIILQCFLELKEKTHLYNFMNLNIGHISKPLKRKNKTDFEYIPEIFTCEIFDFHDSRKEILSVEENDIIEGLYKMKKEEEENKFWDSHDKTIFYEEKKLSEKKFLQKISKLDIHELNFLYGITILSDEYEHRCYGFSEFDCYVSHVDYYYDLYCPNEELTDKECEFLSKCNCRSIILPFCNKISDKGIEYLSQFKGKGLWIPSLDRINCNQAKALSNYIGNIGEKNDLQNHYDYNECTYIYHNSGLHLNGLVRLTDKECEELSKCSCTIYLDGISYLTDQGMKFLSTSNNIQGEYDDETICLDGLKSLNDKQTKYITQSKKIYFSGENLGSISDKQAKYLSKDLHGFKNFKILTEKQRVILKLDGKKLTGFDRIKYNILSFLYKLF